MVLDYNRVQALGPSKDVLDMEPLGVKVEASHWTYKEVDGHDVEAVDSALETLPFTAGQPSWLTAHTVKGKGVSWMEDTVSCHYGSVTDDELAKALAEIGAE